MSRKNKGGQRPSNSGNDAGNSASSASAAEPQANEAGSSDKTDEPTAEAPVDPFADIPTVSVGDGDNAVEFQDFTEQATSNPRKYAQVDAAARAERLPTQKGWKHERHMLVPGTNKKELKAGSVYGTIQQIVNAAGRAGIPAYVVASKLRRMQVGNKRSHYCEALPPIGWAEGWINTAITKNIAGVHSSKEAPAIRTEVTEGEAKANEAEAQGRITAAG